MTEVQRAAENAARDSYGRLVAFLAVRSRDLASAEDALGDAFRSALESWPRVGVPDRPAAWLLTVARRRLLDEARRKRVQAGGEAELRRAAESLQSAVLEQDSFPDERLKLLFVCAHPAIDAAVRTPLMLQTVLGFDAARIAAAFLTAPTAMSQRLVRAKAKIRDAGIAFAVPEPSELPARSAAVLEAIYAAYGSAWEDAAQEIASLRGMAPEAIGLARLLVALLPAEPEAKGLLSLLLHCEARHAARRTADGTYVPLTAQDTSHWSRALLREAESVLQQASQEGRIGGFQLEAAIQSVHAERAQTGVVRWDAIAQLYDGLVRLAPTLGATVGRAAAIGEARGPAAGLALLDRIATEHVRTYQPFWATKAHLLQRLGAAPEAIDAYERAAGLTEDSAVRRFLLARLRSLQSDGPAASARG